MIRKLNAPTAILLVACLTLAPTALAADPMQRGWLADLVHTVKVWVLGDHDQRSAQTERPPADKPNPKPKPTLKCEPNDDGEMGPHVDPNGPGCG